LLQKETMMKFVLWYVASFSVVSRVPAFSTQWSKETLLSFALQAKKKTKGTKLASPTGGFGGGNMVDASHPSPGTSKGHDDTAAFPELEPEVAKTLLAFYGDNSKAQDLSTEIYERLAGIYGFRSFNYLIDDAPDMTLEDLLSSSPAKSSNLADMLQSPPIGNLAIKGQPAAFTLSRIPAFDKFRVLHVDPLVIVVDEFFTPEECDEYIQKSSLSSLKSPFSPMESRSKTVGKDASAKAQRTSTTWFHHYRTVPELMAKASRLMGLDDITQWEEPQTVRYRRNEKFTWHLDALAPSAELEKRGGQRTATLLVYLTDLSEEEGGATMFRDLGGSSGPLRVQPKKGSALLFFPAAGGVPNVPFDIRTLHCGEALSENAENDKWIAQLWLRERMYSPSAPPNNNHNDADDVILGFVNKI